MKPTILKTYIRRDDRSPRGVAVVIRDGDNISYGYSLVNANADQFNKQKGEEIAVHRAESTKGYKLPKVGDRLDAVIKAYTYLEGRAIRYFKDLPEDKIKLQ